MIQMYRQEDLETMRNEESGRMNEESGNTPVFEKNILNKFAEAVLNQRKILALHHNTSKMILKYFLIGVLSLFMGAKTFANNSPEREKLWEEYEQIAASSGKQDIKEVLQSLDDFLQKDLSKYPDILAHALSTKAYYYILLQAVDSIHFYLDQAFEISQRHGIDSLARIPQVKGISLQTSDLEGSILWFRQAFKIAEKYQDKREIIRCAYYLSASFKNTIQMDSAIHYGKLGLNVSVDNAEDSTLFSSIYFNLSDVEGYKGNLIRAIEYLFQGYEMGAKAFNSNRYLSQIYTLKLYNIYHGLGNFPKALELLDHNIRMDNERNTQLYIQQKYILRAGLLIEMDSVEKAQEAVRDLIQNHRIDQDSTYLYEYNALMGSLHFIKEEWTKAEAYLSKLIPIIDQFDDVVLQRVPTDGLLFLARLRYRNARYQDAIRKCEKILTSKMIGHYHRKEFRGTLSACYQKMGDYETAYMILLVRDAVRDTIDYFYEGAARITKEQEVLDQERAQEMTKIRMENELIALKADRQRNLLIFIGLLLTSLLIIVYYWGRQRKLALENILVEVKQQLLKLQVNPHFVFNVLNSIQNSVLNMDKKKSVDLISKFSKLTRQVLENSDKVMVPIHEEIQLLTNYMDLEKVRTQHKFEYEIEIDQGIDVYNENIPSMMLQLFVENAIWHGILPKEEKGLIKITFNKVQDRIKVMVEDDGIGRKRSALTKSEDQKERVSMGMHLVRKRITALNRKYRKNIELLVQNGNNGQGTAVLLFA